MWTIFMRLGEGKRAIESAEGLGGIGASTHTWQQTRGKKNVTFFGPNCRLRKKDPKIVLSRRLRTNKKQREVRIKWACRGVWRLMGHLLHVETALKTHRNLKNLGCKA
jgi:hypothetical protein